jgi:hypothetical protein
VQALQQNSEMGLARLIHLRPFWEALRHHPSCKTTCHGINPIRKTTEHIGKERAVFAKQLHEAVPEIARGIAELSGKFMPVDGVHGGYALC